MSRHVSPIGDRLFVHVCNKSIAGYEIFSNHSCANYFLQALDYYRFDHVKCLARSIRDNEYEPNHLLLNTQRIRILAYCIMPTHYHVLLIAPSLSEMVKYIATVENSYTRYFNRMHKRRGPLWQSRFRKTTISSNKQLLHVMRYIHLNPTSACLTETPQEWKLSSYKEFISSPKWINSMPEISIRNVSAYEQFVANNTKYQRSLQKLKPHFLDR